MATIVPISDLQEATLPLNGNDLVVIVQGGVTKKTTINDVRGVVPEITLSETTLTFPDTEVNEISSPQTFNASGENLTSNIVITAPAGFIINLDGSTSNNSPVTLIPVGGIVSETLVYMRFSPTVEQVYNSEVTATSTGAVSKTIDVDGEGIVPQFEFVVQPINVKTFDVPERDGAMGFEDDLNSDKFIVGGWNPIDFPVTLSTNQQFKSTDDLLSTTQLSDAPWSPRHTFGCKKLSNGNIIVYGADDQETPGTAIGDSWLWNVNTKAWTNLTTDMGIVWGNRYKYAHAISPGNIIWGIGGVINDVVYSTDFGLTWTKLFDIPDGYNVGSGYACYHDGEIFVICGQDNRGKAFKITDNLTTFEALPDLTGQVSNCDFPVIASYMGSLIFISGSGTIGVNGETESFSNKAGVSISKDNAQTWTPLSSFTMRGSHARAVFTSTDGETLYITMGNGSPDSNRIILSPYVPLNYKAVYSVKKVIIGYSGNCIEVRRDSDDTTLNIGFSGNNLDTASLLSFVGAGNGYVRTWYDQTGVYNLVQATNAQQPRIVNSGVVETDNSNPTINFASGTLNLRLSSALNITTNYMMSAVVNFTSGEHCFGRNVDGSGYVFYNSPSNAGVYHNNNAADPFISFIDNAIASGSQNIVSVSRTRQKSKTYINATETIALPPFTIGGFPTYWDTDFEFTGLGAESPAFIGKVSEFGIKIGVVETGDSAANQTEINSRFNTY